MKQLHTYLTVLSVFVVSFLLFACSDDTDNDIINPSSGFKWGDTKADVMRGLGDCETDITSNTIYATRLKDDIHTAYQFSNDSLCAIVIMASESQIDEKEVKRYASGFDFVGSISEQKDIYINSRQNKILQIQEIEIDETKYHSIGWAPIE